MPPRKRAGAISQKGEHMAHDVGFYKYDATGKHSDNAIAYFFGYASGLLYRAFDATECDAGVSGTCEGVTRSAEQMRSGVAALRNADMHTSHPHFQQLHETIEKLNAYLDDHPDASVFVHFS